MTKFRIYYAIKCKNMQTYLRVWVKLIDWWNCTKVVKMALDLRCVVHVVVFPPSDWVPPVRSCSLCIMISCDTGAYFHYSPFYTVFYLHMIFIRPYVNLSLQKIVYYKEFLSMFTEYNVLDISTFCWIHMRVFVIKAIVFNK